MLIDTQSIFWLSFEPERISKNAVRAIAEAGQKRSGLAISDSTLWELAMMVQYGYVTIATTLGEYLAEVERRYRVLPITGQIAAKSAAFSDRYPKDPTDRLIGATALVHNLPLITADKKIRNSGEVPCIW